MSPRKNGWALGESLLAMVLMVGLAGLLAFATACQELDPGPESDSVGSTTITSAADVPDSPDSLFGTWDGTYTPDTAWDENGPVDDPPFALNTPVAMHMELRPWSAESADYGTIGAGGLYPARVVSLSLEGGQVTLVVSTAASGLSDLLGMFTLTLDGDTLSGEDERRPEVPSGWISTSGTVHLTRTARWDAAAVPETTPSTEAPEPDDVDDSGSEDGGGADDSPGDPPLQQIPTEPQPPALSLGAGDHGRHGTIAVGDSVQVRLEYSLDDEVAQVRWNSTSSSILFLRGELWTQDPETGIYTVTGATFDAHAPGHVGIVFLAQHADGTLHQMWQYYLVVE